MEIKVDELESVYQVQIFREKSIEPERSMTGQGGTAKLQYFVCSEGKIWDHNNPKYAKTYGEAYAAMQKSKENIPEHFKDAWFEIKQNIKISILTPMGSDYFYSEKKERHEVNESSN